MRAASCGARGCWRATSARTGGQDCRVAIGHVAEPRQDVVAQVGAPAIHGPAAGIPVPGVHRDHFLAGFGEGGRAAGVGDRVPRRWPGRSRAYFFAASKFSSGNVEARFEDVFQRGRRWSHGSAVMWRNARKSAESGRGQPRPGPSGCLGGCRKRRPRYPGQGRCRTVVRGGRRRRRAGVSRARGAVPRGAPGCARTRPTARTP